MNNNSIKVCDDRCDNCIYIGEGDFICDAVAELVIDEWSPIYEYCIAEGRSYKSEE